MKPIGQEDVLVFDMDFVIFDAVSVSEEKFITATHKPTGQVLELDNVTALWGDWRKKVGGWIGLKNSVAGTDYYKAEDFEVVPGHRPRPFRQKGKLTGIDENGNEVRGPDTFMSPSDGAKMIIDEKIKSICAKLNCHNYRGYTGSGDVFRHKLATLLPYKGNREDLLRPLLLDEMKAYVCERHNSKMIYGIETDDAFCIDVLAGYKAWKAAGRTGPRVIGVAVDKDSKGTEGWHFDPNNDVEPRLIEGFGGLWLNDKGKVDGKGRMWLYFQVANGDAADNYKANCFSDKKWAEKGAYNALKDCTTDKEAFTALVDVFKMLYPEKKTVEGCKGPVEIDWLHVMQEMFSLAMMLRHEGDKIDVKAVLTKLGVEH
jgi:hypothetical protein